MGVWMGVMSGGVWVGVCGCLGGSVDCGCWMRAWVLDGSVDCGC